MALPKLRFHGASNASGVCLQESSSLRLLVQKLPAPTALQAPKGPSAATASSHTLKLSPFSLQTGTIALHIAKLDFNNIYKHPMCSKLIYCLYLTGLSTHRLLWRDAWKEKSGLGKILGKLFQKLLPSCAKRGAHAHKQVIKRFLRQQTFQKHRTGVLKLT